MSLFRFLQNTLLLRAIPGLNEFGKALLGECFLQNLVALVVSWHKGYDEIFDLSTVVGSMTEQIMLLENIGTSVLVSKNQVSVFKQCPCGHYLSLTGKET